MHMNFHIIWFQALYISLSSTRGTNVSCHIEVYIMIYICNYVFIYNIYIYIGVYIYNYYVGNITCHNFTYAELFRPFPSFCVILY